MSPFYAPIAKKNLDKCRKCGVCDEIVACSSGRVGYVEGCIGCGACGLTCPYEAVSLKDEPRLEEVRIKVDGESFTTPSKITVKRALELLGYRFTKFPERDAIFAPCDVGGCYSCALMIDGELKPSCITEVGEGMVIETKVSRAPLRLVHGWMGHSVGGVGTPWYLKGGRYVEAAAFA